MNRAPKCVDVGVHASKKSTRKSKSSDYPLADQRQDIEANLCWHDSPRTKAAGTNTTSRRTKQKQGNKKFTKPKCTGDGEGVVKNVLPLGSCPTIEEVQKRLNLVLDLDLEGLGSEAPHIEDKSLLDAFKHLLENKEVKNAVDHWIKLQLPGGKKVDTSSSDEKILEKDKSAKTISFEEEYLSLIKKKQKKEKNKPVPRCQAQMSLVPTAVEETKTRKTRKESADTADRGSSGELFAAKLQKHQIRAADETAVAEAASGTVSGSAASRRSNRAARPARVLTKVRSRRVLAPRTLFIPPRIRPGFSILNTVSGSDSEIPMSSVPGCPFTPPDCRSQCTSLASAISKRNSNSDRTIVQRSSYSLTSPKSVSPDATATATHKSTNRRTYTPRRARRHREISVKTRSSRPVHSDTDSTGRNSPTEPSEPLRKSSMKLHIRLPHIASGDDKYKHPPRKVAECPESASTAKASSSPGEESLFSSCSKRGHRKIIRHKRRFTSANTQTSKNSNKTNATQTHHARQKQGAQRNLDKLAEACRLLVDELSRRDEAAAKSVPRQESGQQTDSQPTTDAEVNTSKRHHSKSRYSKHTKSSGGEKHKKHDSNKKCSQRIQTEVVDQTCIIPFLRSTNEGEAAFSLLKLSKGVLMPFSGDLMSIPCSPDLQPSLTDITTLQVDISRDQNDSDEQIPSLKLETPLAILPPGTLNNQKINESSEEQPDKSEQCSDTKCIEHQYTIQDEREKPGDESFVKEIVFNIEETSNWNMVETPDEFPLQSKELDTYTCLKSVPTDENYESFVVYSNTGVKFPVAQVSVSKRSTTPRSRSNYSVGRSQSKTRTGSKVSKATSVSRIGSQGRLSDGGGDNATRCVCDASTAYSEDGEMGCTGGQSFEGMVECDTFEVTGTGAGPCGFFGGSQGSFGGMQNSYGVGGGPGAGITQFGCNSYGNGPCPPGCPCSCSGQCCCLDPQRPSQFGIRNVAQGEVPPCQIPSPFASPRPALKLVSDLGPMQGPCGRAPFAPPPYIPCSGPPTNIGSIFGPCPKHGDVPLVPNLLPCAGTGPVVTRDNPCTCNTWANNWNNCNAGTPCTCGRAQYFCQMQSNNNNNNNSNVSFVTGGGNSSHRVPAEKECEDHAPANFFRSFCKDA